MTWVTLSLSAGAMLAMAVIFSYILGWANKAFHVETDPRVEAALDVLPGANCGGCGFVGCGEYAEAVAGGQAPVNKCGVGGESCAAALAAIMGVELGASFPLRPVVHCGAHCNDRRDQSDYRGERSCIAAGMVSGVHGCIYGCLGFGDCQAVCDYDAIQVKDGLAAVDYEKCVGCGACAKACPRHLIELVPFKARRMLVVACASHDSAKDVKRVCTAGCFACKACERVSDLFKLDRNLAVIDYDAYPPDEALADALLARKRCPNHTICFVGQGTAAEAEMVEESPLEADDQRLAS